MNEGFPLHAYTEDEFNNDIEGELNAILKQRSNYVKLSKASNEAEYEKIKEEIVNDWVNKKYKGPKIGDLVETHNYVFVGRSGQFCPIIPDAGGGLLVREQNGKFVFVTDSSEYRWLESEMVRTLNMEDCIDLGYYRAKVDEAIEAIAQYGDPEWFINEESNPD